MIVALVSLSPLYGQVIPSQIVPDLSKADDAGGEAMKGGYPVRMACPEGIEDFEWKKKKFSLHFSVQILDGQVVSVSRTFREEEPAPWVKKFETSCIDALKQWKFSKVWTKKGEKKGEWGMTLHVTFQTNKQGECNVTVDRGAIAVYLSTNPTFLPDGSLEE
jgi:hypothetical protein